MSPILKFLDGQTLFWIGFIMWLCSIPSWWTTGFGPLSTIAIFITIAGAVRWILHWMEWSDARCRMREGHR